MEGFRRTKSAKQSLWLPWAFCARGKERKREWQRKNVISQSTMQEGRGAEGRFSMFSPIRPHRVYSCPLIWHNKATRGTLLQASHFERRQRPPPTHHLPIHQRLPPIQEPEETILNAPLGTFSVCVLFPKHLKQWLFLCGKLATFASCLLPGQSNWWPNEKMGSCECHPSGHS